MAKNVPKRRRCPPATTTAGTSQTKTQTRDGQNRARPNAHLYSTRQPAIRSTVHPTDLTHALDACCTLSAIISSHFAAMARLLAEHEREIGGLGADVAAVARMATTALQAAELLHQVQGEYQDWQVTP